jgi:hypothetical protein
MYKTRQLYLDLMKKCLTGMIYKEEGLGISYVLPNFLDFITNNFIIKHKLHLGKTERYEDSVRREGRDWPLKAHTMIGLKRLENIQLLVEQILKNSIAGDFIEAGVWRGGAVIFMRALLKAYGINNKIVWVADSFEGLPQPNLRKYPQDKKSYLHKVPFLSVSLEEVKHNFQCYDLLDGQVSFLKGWFKNTLSKAKIQRLSLIRIDADMYESTMDALVSLYPKLSKGGFIIIDEYLLLDSCRKAVDDFRHTNNIVDKIIQIDWSGIYWKRS